MSKVDPAVHPEKKRRLSTGNGQIFHTGNAIKSADMASDSRSLTVTYSVDSAESQSTQVACVPLAPSTGVTTKDYMRTLQDALREARETVNTHLTDLITADAKPGEVLANLDMDDDDEENGSGDE